jgi:hypothetical protein
MNETRPDEHLLVNSNELILVSASDASGTPHEAALPFVYEDGVIYVLADKGADWYRNVERDKGVVVRIGRRGFRGRAKLVDARQRARMAEQIASRFKKKYRGSALKGPDPRQLLPVTIDIQF